jgi:hypothetical protein
MYPLPGVTKRNVANVGMAEMGRDGTGSVAVSGAKARSGATGLV